MHRSRKGSLIFSGALMAGCSAETHWLADPVGGGSALETGGAPAAAPAGGAATDQAAGGASLASAGLSGNPDSVGGAGAQGGLDGAGGSTAPLCSRWMPCQPPLVLEFVIAADGSMNEPLGGDGLTTKWEALAGILSNAFASLPSNWAAGVVYFNQPESGCYSGVQSVPIAPLTSEQLGLLQASASARMPSGYEPTLAAWRFGLAELERFSAPPAYLHSSRYLVLVTDGVPTVQADGCTLGDGATTHWISMAEYAALVDAVKAEGSEAHIDTVVVGTPGSDDPQGAPYDPLFMLSELAVAGGVTHSGCTSVPNGDGADPLRPYCHVDLNRTEDLGGGIEERIRRICALLWSCVWYVPLELVPPRTLAVTYQVGVDPSRRLVQAADSSCADGEWYVEAVDSLGSPTQIMMCPGLCVQMYSDALYWWGEMCLEVT